MKPGGGEGSSHLCTNKRTDETFVLDAGFREGAQWGNIC